MPLNQPSEIPPAPFGVSKNIVIIGGGVTGTLLAFELQRAGHQVILLEAQSWGNGSSSRSAACIRAQFGTQSTVKGMVYATRFYRDWRQIIGGPVSPITQNGYLFLKDHKTDIAATKRTVEMQRAAGLTEVEILTRADLDVRFPYLETTGIQAATWCPTDGFLEPAAVYGDAVVAAEQLGAKVVQKAEVVDFAFEADDRPVRAYTRAGDFFSADLFVNAAGVWAPHISHLLRGYPLDIKAHRRYLYFLKGMDGLDGEFMSADDFQHMPMVITPRGAYCRPESAHGGKLMMGWAHPTKAVRPGFGNQDDIERGFACGEPASYGLAIRKEIAAYLPEVERMGEPVTVTTGFYEDTPDHNPFIGYDPWVSNLIHAAGFSGHGLMHAPFTAHIVAHLAANGADLPSVPLPFGLGEADTTSFGVGRSFKDAEDMVI